MRSAVSDRRRLREGDLPGPLVLDQDVGEAAPGRERFLEPPFVEDVLDAADDRDAGTNETDVDDLVLGPDVGKWRCEGSSHGVGQFVASQHPPATEVHDDGVAVVEGQQRIDVVLRVLQPLYDGANLRLAVMGPVGAEVVEVLDERRREPVQAYAEVSTKKFSNFAVMDRTSSIQGKPT